VIHCVQKRLVDEAAPHNFELLQRTSGVATTLWTWAWASPAAWRSTQSRRSQLLPCSQVLPEVLPRNTERNDIRIC
jgi:hypothetical protein